MKNAHATAAVMLAVVALLGACSPERPPAEVLRPVRTVPLSYDTAGEANRYVGTVQSRHEVDQAFRVGGKVVQRKVDVGQSVREGEVIAVLDDADYRLAEQALSQQLIAATAQARQAESDRDRLAALKTDGSVSQSDEERAHSSALSAKAAAEAKSRELELARNKLTYTVLRAPRSGVVTAVRFEVGQVVAEGQPVVSIAGQAEPEIVVDVPEDNLAPFKGSSYQAWLASAPEQKFDLVLRELSPQAAAQTRTYRARLKPATARALPLGATATVVVERAAGATPVAAIPASAMTQRGGKPAVWVVRPAGSAGTGSVELLDVAVHAYRNDQVLVSGPPAGALVVSAGVQKMAPGLKVALASAAPVETTQQASR